MAASSCSIITCNTVHVPQRLPRVLHFFNCTRFSYRKASWCQSVLFYQSTCFFHKPSEPHSSAVHPLCGTHSLSTLCYLWWCTCLWEHGELAEDGDHITPLFIFPKWHSVQLRAGTQQRYAQYVILSFTQQSYLHVYQPLILQREISSSQKQRRSSLLEGLRLWGWPRSVLELDTSCNT